MEQPLERILVCAGTSAQRFCEIHEEVGCVFIEEIPKINVHVVSVQTNHFQAATCHYCTYKEVKFAEQDGMVQSTLIPNAPLFPQQYGLPKIQAPEVMY